MKEFRQFVNALSKDWTLFLDRDGVINKRLPDEYVKTPQDFEFIDGVQESINFLSFIFGRIIVVTNQQGIGRNLMSEAMVVIIHNQMIGEIAKTGGRINKVYFCPDLATDPNNRRKPDSYMAYQAKSDFPEIDFTKSVMVGDSHSDIEFGNRLGMTTIYIGNQTIPANTNFVFNSLSDFTQNLKTGIDGISMKGESC